MTRTGASVILGPMRLPFLVLPPACVLLGAATASWSGRDIDLVHLLIVFAGAVSAHISVNALNEYDDFKSGLDFNTRRTPFSGGSGTLPARPDRAPAALFTGILALAITAAVGIYFVYVRGFWLLPLGALGLINIATYTRWQTRSPLLCLIAPGVGFGPLMVMGTHFALTGAYSWASLVASLVPFFLVSDLLLMNQFPDVEPDRGIGRYHLPIAVGRKASAKIYAAFLAGAYLSILAGCLAGVLPKAGLIALASLVLAVSTAKGALRHADDIPRLVPYMGRNVVVIIATPVLLAIGIFVG